MAQREGTVIVSADDPPPDYGSAGSANGSASSLAPMLQAEEQAPQNSRRSTDASRRASTSSAAPPPYDPAEGGSPSGIVPPSYESLYGRIAAERARASTVGEFIFAVLLLLLGTVGVLALFALSLGVPLAMIVMGAKKWDAHCTSDKLALYLVVGGVCGVVLQLHAIGTKVYTTKKKRARAGSDTSDSAAGGGDRALGAEVTIDGVVQDREDDGTGTGGRKKTEEPCGCPITLVRLFTAAWFVCGNVWVYRYDPGTDYVCCDRTLYLFTFWLITSIYIAIGSVFVLFTCLTCCMLCCRPPPREGEQQPQSQSLA